MTEDKKKRKGVAKSQKKGIDRPKELFLDESYVELIKGLNKSDIDFEIPTAHEKIRSDEIEIESGARKRRRRAEQFDKKVIEYDDSVKKWRERKVRTKIGLGGLFCIITISVYIMYISAIELYQMMNDEFVYLSFLYYMIILILGAGAFAGGLKLARSIIMVEYIFDTTFEEEIYTRLEPALREVAKVQVEMDDMKVTMDRMNLNINKLRDHPPSHYDPVKSIEATVSIFLRYVLLINVSLGILIFMLLYPSNYTPYILTLLFPIWWVGITSEFKLWKVDEVWAWVFMPILIIPVSIIVFDVVLEYGSLIGLIGGGLLVYAFAYRSWAKHYVQGISPFEALRRARESEIIEPNEPKKKIKRKRVVRRNIDVE
ncbi:MAG: hypothetical protein JSV49_10150 [Thermoplasmata archaeon]|nr:MAG: hypothetical protein JSV49_10150 [Thermoplasmata archaeon]